MKVNFGKAHMNGAKGVIKMTVTDNLLPCPFCGSRAYIDIQNDHHGDYFHLGCIDEECFQHLAYYTSPIESKSDAVTQWNTRAPIVNVPVKDASGLVSCLEKIAKRPDLPNPERDADWKNCTDCTRLQNKIIDEALQAYEAALK